ncbi:MAG: SGNH/GDSL hydrolase family protein [Bacilli bacterium]|nr:SGNH/GDSL hydrolase family protein [Bacilli bacterium]
MKKIIIPILIVFLVFIIYKTNDEKLIDYMVLGDSISLGINSYGNKTYGYNDYIKRYLENNNLMHRYNNYFSKSNYTIKELTDDIENNKNILYDDKTYNIKRELREADLLTLSIGMDEFVKILNKNNIEFDNIKVDLDNIISQMDTLLEKITEFSKAKIILVGYYNPKNNYNKNIDRIFAYMNSEYLNLSKKYNIDYVDIYNSIKSDSTYLPNELDYHLTSRGYLKISRDILEKNNL